MQLTETGVKATVAETVPLAPAVIVQFWPVGCCKIATW